MDNNIEESFQSEEEDDDDQDQKYEKPFFPNSNDKSDYRACEGCHLIMTQKQFDDLGCPNCGTRGEYLKTSKKMFGLINAIKPKRSWVLENQISAKIKKDVKQLVPGAYAVSVEQLY